jgi:hypothetical protein
MRRHTGAVSTVKMLRRVACGASALLAVAACSSSAQQARSTTTTSGPTLTSVTESHPAELQLTEMSGAPVHAQHAAQLRLFYDALVAGDTATLDSSFAPTAIADPAQRSTFWHDQDRRDAALLALSTHPAGTDGLTYPGFMLGGFSTPLAIEDGQNLGLHGSTTPPADGYGYSEMQRSYRGWVITLEDDPATSDLDLVLVNAGPSNP